MWEKIVLNLVSNSFKFTLAGEITVVLSCRGDHVELTVSDTGVGIPGSELPRIFDRFYRVEGARGRTSEGTGIGLALVRDLVKLHGGTLSAESVAGQGSTFGVVIPLGTAHLPPDRLHATPKPASTASAFVQEASGWLSDETLNTAISAEQGDTAPLSRNPSENRPRIVLAEDNADMRAYVGHLLEAALYRVDVFANGAAALAACAAAPPDLIVTDVMMPELDGFTLLHRLRADPSTDAIPVILVSARAGEEARIEGLRAGADDYIVKPFGAREFVARVEGAIRLTRARHAAAMRERELQAEIEAARAKAALREREGRIRRLIDANIIGILIWEFEGRVLEANDAFLQIVGYNREDVASGRLCWTDLTPPEWRDRDTQQWVPELKMTGHLQPFEKEYFRKDGSRVPVLIGAATFEEGGNQGVAFVLDLTGRKRAEAEAHESELRYREMQMELAHANRLSTMGQFTASIAHEVNQPIAAMIMNAGAALNWLNLKPPDLGEARRVLDCVVSDARRAGDVISSLRDLVKKTPTRNDRIEINGALREVIELTRGDATKKGVSVRTELADGLPPVQGNRVQLQQVTLNLIVNAIEAMSASNEGPRELLIGTGTAESGDVLVTVRDSGPGLSQAALDRVFQSFYTTKPSGMGLGLSICRSIVEVHGGRLRASANFPRGAVFQFTVPAAEET
jgi:PAS domain S-box-containing protein